MNDPGQHKLWSIPGNGVLARQGSLVLLIGIDDREFAESLLELLVRTSQAGGDGRALRDAISRHIEEHQSWGGLEGGPAVVAFGPAGDGLAFTVSGTAFLEFSTSHEAKHRLTAGHPSMLLGSTVGVPVLSVRATLGGDGSGDKTDRFTRLDRGTVRAGGLSYYADPPAASPARPASPAQPLSPGQPEAPDTGSRPEVPGQEPALPDQPTRPPAQSSSQGSAADTLPPVPATPATPPSAYDPARYGASESPYGGVPSVEVADAAPVPSTEVDLPSTAVDLDAPAPPQSPAPGPAAAGAGESTVLGVYCKNGHFTDPDARSCLTCGTGIKRRSVTPQPGPRPPLGLLILNDGTNLVVDGDYVIGRNPTADQSVEAGMARPARVVDAESMVSRVHARIHLDGWQVLLSDLGSANGTRIQPQGTTMPRQLEPQVPVPIQHGTLIFAGAACLRYISPRDADHL